MVQLSDSLIRFMNKFIDRRKFVLNRFFKDRFRVLHFREEEF